MPGALAVGSKDPETNVQAQSRLVALNQVISCKSARVTFTAKALLFGVISSACTELWTLSNNGTNFRFQ